jgi:hypothetical protein
MRETDEGVYVTLPERVEVYPDGRFDVVTREVGPFRHGVPSSKMPDRLPMWTVKLDGSRVPGYPMRPFTETPNYPQAVLFDQSGYEIRYFECISTHNTGRAHENTHEWRRLQTGWTVATTQKDWLIPVRSHEVWLKPSHGSRYRERLMENRRDRGAPFDLRFQLDQTSDPAGQLSAIQQVLFRVEEKIEGLLSQDAGLLRVTGGFDPALPLGTPAMTDVIHDLNTLTNVSANLVLFGFTDGETSQEILLYEQFPASISVQKSCRRCHRPEWDHCRSFTRYQVA